MGATTGSAGQPAPQPSVTDHLRAAFNIQLEPSIRSTAGVTATHVDFNAAKLCAEFLQHGWQGNELVLGKGLCCRGYSSYPKTLLDHDADEQMRTTLLITGTLLPSFRIGCPGFEEMERELLRWLAEKYDFEAELSYGHALRQSRETLRSTGFGLHQDTEDDPTIEFTVVQRAINIIADSNTAFGFSPFGRSVVGNGTERNPLTLNCTFRLSSSQLMKWVRRHHGCGCSLPRPTSSTELRRAQPVASARLTFIR